MARFDFTTGFGRQRRKFGTLTVFAVAALCLYAGWRLARPVAAPEPDSGPLLIAMRNIGQLHSASYTMKDVLRQETEQTPTGLLADIPGGVELTHWATRNKALVTAEGTVEAGIDLSQISPADISREKQPDGATLFRVHLPPVSVYPPTVKVRVEDHSRGLLWRDENIAPAAQQEASRRFIAAAEADGIRRKAACNAIETLQKLQKSVGNGNVVFSF